MHGRTAAVAAGDGRQKFQTPILGLPSTELDTSGAAFGADSGPSSGGEPDLLGSFGGVISIQPEPLGSLTRPITARRGRQVRPTHAYEVLRLHRRKIIAAIEDPPVIIKILSHLGLPTRAPPRAPAHRVDLFQTI